MDRIDGSDPDEPQDRLDVVKPETVESGVMEPLYELATFAEALGLHKVAGAMWDVIRSVISLPFKAMEKADRLFEALIHTGDLDIDLKIDGKGMRLLNIRPIFVIFLGTRPGSAAEEAVARAIENLANDDAED
jgi:hypothetical protein